MPLDPIHLTFEVANRYATISRRSFRNPMIEQNARRECLKSSKRTSQVGASPPSGPSIDRQSNFAVNSHINIKCKRTTVFKSRLKGCIFCHECRRNESFKTRKKLIAVDFTDYPDFNDGHWVKFVRALTPAVVLRIRQIFTSIANRTDRYPF